MRRGWGTAVPRRPPDVRSKALLPVGELGGRATGVFLSGPVNPRSEAALEELGGTAQEGETLWGCARQDDPHRRVAEEIGRRLRLGGRLSLAGVKLCQKGHLGSEVLELIPVDAPVGVGIGLRKE